LMAALRSQNQITMLAYHGMQQSYQAHDEVAAVETQLASLMRGSLSEDVAAQARKLDASLKKIGGEMTAGGGGFFRRQASDPNELQSFLNLNNEYNTLVSMMQVGLDMAPTPTQIATWGSDCRNYNRTANAWSEAQKQITDFNSVLARSHLQELTVGPTKISESQCSFNAGASKRH